MNEVSFEKHIPSQYSQEESESLLGALSCFESINAQNVPLLAQLCSIVNIEAGEKIIQAGENASFIVIVINGVIDKMYGSELVESIKRGSIVDAHHFFLPPIKRIRANDYVSVMPSVVGILPFIALTTLPKAHPALHSRLCKILGNHGVLGLMPAKVVEKSNDTKIKRQSIIAIPTKEQKIDKRELFMKHKSLEQPMIVTLSSSNEIQQNLAADIENMSSQAEFFRDQISTLKNDNKKLEDTIGSLTFKLERGTAEWESERHGLARVQQQLEEAHKHEKELKLQYDKVLKHFLIGRFAKQYSERKILRHAYGVLVRTTTAMLGEILKLSPKDSATVQNYSPDALSTRVNRRIHAWPWTTNRAKHIGRKGGTRIMMKQMDSEACLAMESTKELMHLARHWKKSNEVFFGDDIHLKADLVKLREELRHAHALHKEVIAERDEAVRKYSVLKRKSEHHSNDHKGKKDDKKHSGKQRASNTPRLAPLRQPASARPAKKEYDGNAKISFDNKKLFQRSVELKRRVASLEQYVATLESRKALITKQKQIMEDNMERNQERLEDQLHSKQYVSSSNGRVVTKKPRRGNYHKKNNNQRVRPRNSSGNSSVNSSHKKLPYLLTPILPPTPRDPSVKQSAHRGRAAAAESEKTTGLQITILIIKPGAVKMYDEAILGRLRKDGFEIVDQEKVYLQEEQVARLLQDHQHEEHFSQEVVFLSSKPVLIVALRRNDAVKRLKILCGPEDPHEAQGVAPYSFRAQYGSDWLHNAVYCSSSAKLARKETQYLFGTVIHDVRFASSASQEQMDSIDALINEVTTPAEKERIKARRQKMMEQADDHNNSIDIVY